MPTKKPIDLTPIEIGSLEELQKSEGKIVRRINNTPNGGRLFLADPIRLLMEINIHLSASAQRALEEKLGAQDLASNPLRSLYDDFKRDKPDRSVTVIIRGILP